MGNRMLTNTSIKIVLLIYEEGYEYSHVTNEVTGEELILRGVMLYIDNHALLVLRLAFTVNNNPFHPFFSKVKHSHPRVHCFY